MSNVTYYNYWNGFNPEEHLLDRLFQQSKKPLRILGPFKPHRRIQRSIQTLSLFVSGKADFFVTGENKSPMFSLAKKQIGFWKSYTHRSDVFRFPYWMWHLDYPEIDRIPAYQRYGRPISIERLMRPISESYSIEQRKYRKNNAVIFTAHLNEPRHRLFHITKTAVGCDGFGAAFGVDNRQSAKMPVLERYNFNLCPENSIGDGYITEKIPEAFHAGCIPITWCRPEDLEEDFNPEAVVNLYGLDDQQCIAVLEEIKGGGSYFRALQSAPLVSKRPSIAPLVKFIQGI